LGYNTIADNMGLSFIFIHLAVVASQICKIPQNSNLQQFKVIQGHRSWCQSKTYMQQVSG